MLGMRATKPSAHDKLHAHAHTHTCAPTAGPEEKDKGRVFGVPVEQATTASKIAENYELPAIIYRCVEYLESQKAYTEVCVLLP